MCWGIDNTSIIWLAATSLHTPTIANTWNNNLPKNAIYQRPYWQCRRWVVYRIMCTVLAPSFVQYRRIYIYTAVVGNVRQKKYIVCARDSRRSSRHKPANIIMCMVYGVLYVWDERCDDEKCMRNCFSNCAANNQQQKVNWENKIVLTSV